MEEPRRCQAQSVRTKKTHRFRKKGAHPLDGHGGDDTGQWPGDEWTAALGYRQFGDDVFAHVVAEERMAWAARITSGVRSVRSPGAWHARRAARCGIRPWLGRTDRRCTGRIHCRNMHPDRVQWEAGAWDRRACRSVWSWGWAGAGLVKAAASPPGQPDLNGRGCAIGVAAAVPLSAEALLERVLRRPVEQAPALRGVFLQVALGLPSTLRMTAGAPCSAASANSAKR